MGKGNFFTNIFNSIFGGNDPDVAKKRQLKSISKSLSKTKYKFYRMNSHEADPGVAKYLYEIYKVISPAQVMFQVMTPNALKAMVLDASLTEKQKLLIDELSEESLNELSRKIKFSELESKVKENLELISSEFDDLKIAKIDDLYTKVNYMKSFCLYDFYFILRKFDNTLKERDFNITPKFSSINGSYISEDLKNFIAVAWAIPFDSDWDDVFKMLKAAKGVEPITLQNWKRVMSRLRAAKDKRAFEMTIQLITEDPLYREEIKNPDMHVIDDYISQVKKQAESFLDNYKAKQTAGKVDVLLNQIFGTSEIDPLKHYNETGSSPFERKSLGSFAYAEPLSYLWQFLLDFTKKDIRELGDILLVRGEWTNQQLAQPMSEAVHQLMALPERISKLDERLAENSDLGMKLKTYLPRADRDKESRNIIEMLLEDINSEAGNIILTATRNYVIFDRNLKMLVEDCVKPHSELILNWKDLDRFAEGVLKQTCINVYKKIYAFVALIQNFPIQVTQQEEEPKKDEDLS